MRNHEQDMGAKRRKLYAKFGYDVKYASHAIRLIWQLNDILTFGHMLLPYGDNKTRILKEIKLGQWSLDEFDALYEAEVNSTDLLIESMQDNLPETTDYERIAEILEGFYIEILR